MDLKHIKLALVGATGAVGREVLDVLKRRHIALADIGLFASRRSEGKRIATPLGERVVECVDDADFSRYDVAIFSAGGKVSAAHAPRAVANGCAVIDNTSAFRMQEGVALVVPEVNGELIGSEPAIIANPNCSTIQMVLALAPLHKEGELIRVNVSTYQSCSGAGQKGIDALVEETKAALAGDRQETSEVHARGIAFDCVPQIGTFLNDGYTEEEEKMMRETAKILDSHELGVCATCVRVPVMRGHSEVVVATTKREISLQRAYELLKEVPDLIVAHPTDNQDYITSVQCEKRFETFVSRLRIDPGQPNTLVMWVVSDNLLKGAALNAVQILEIYGKNRRNVHEDR